MSAQRGPSLLVWAACALTLAACAEPTFVSLGRNTQSVARPDADPEVRADPDVSAEPDPDVTADLVDSCGESPVDSLLPGCEQSARAASCTLGNAPMRIESACDTRRSVACPSDLAGDGERLNRVLSDLLAGCTVRGHYLTVTFNNGCASAFSLDPIDAPGAESASECVAVRLAAERYACAESLACGVGSSFQVPTR